MDLHLPYQSKAAPLSFSSFWQPDYLVESAWFEHAPFLSWLIDTLRPSQFVELGCHTGYSYFVACQVVKRLGLRTSCFAIDTWQGDEQAGFYADDVFAAVHRHNATHYEAFSKLLRFRFSEAVSLFADGSIDLLHIDGRHFYEDVAEDFQSWRSKLTPDAIVLLHDTMEREHQFGVWKFFRELSGQYPTHEFLHGHGLGVVATGQIPPGLAALFSGTPDAKDFANVAYSTLGRAITERWLLRQAGEREQGYQAEISRVTTLLADRHSAESASSNGEDLSLEAERQALAGRLSEFEDRLAELRGQIAEREHELSSTRAANADAESKHADQASALLVAEGRLTAQRLNIDRIKRNEEEGRLRLAQAQAEIGRLTSERNRILSSASWRMTALPRRLFARHPRAFRAMSSSARLAWWIATLRFGRVIAGLRTRRRLRFDEATLAGSPMFDADYYRQQCADSEVSGWSLPRHYLVRGQFQKLNPHPLFKARWYENEYTDIDFTRISPLVHYVRYGRIEGRKPNAFFDPDWYLRHNPDVAITNVDPVQHFMLVGASEGRDPSRQFKTTFYLERYHDVLASGINPLVHFLEAGLYEGRDARDFDTDFADAAAVIGTTIECRKCPRIGREAALFVTHSPNGKLKPHVRHYLESLVREGIAVTLIVAADQGFTDDEPWLLDLVDGLYVRANEGWDFACWAHVMRLNRGFFRANLLYWLNDSLIGPTTQEALHKLIVRIREHPAALVGLTMNQERGEHIQSYFLSFKKPALQALAFHDFLLGIQSLPDKEDVINAYEIRLAPHLNAAGVQTAALFDLKTVSNPTIYQWKKLLDDGFAFLKVLAIDNDLPLVDKSDWRETLARHGYDVSIADRVLEERERPTRHEPGVARPVDRRLPASPRLLFVGPWNYDNGLGVAGRGYVNALMHMGAPTNILPVHRPFHIHRRVTPTLASTEFVSPPDVAMVQLNPESWGPLLTSEQWEAIEKAKYRIGLFVWESQEPPASGGGRLPHLDMVWVPSRFSAPAFEGMADTLVRVVPYAVDAGSTVQNQRRAKRARYEFGIGEDKRVILFSFDASSYLPRKNPGALLNAFNEAGLAAKGWSLILKTKHLTNGSVDGGNLAVLAARSPGVTLIDRSVDIETARALMDIADVYASPHASEGFGLTIAEAMARGKVVVASDFGGSADFLDASCGFPVRCEPWRLDDAVGPYPSGTIWGRVDEAAFAKALAAVADMTPHERETIGEQARQRVRDQLSAASVARRMQACLDELRTLASAA